MYSIQDIFTEVNPHIYSRVPLPRKPPKFFFKYDSIILTYSFYYVFVRNQMQNDEQI